MNTEHAERLLSIEQELAVWHAKKAEVAAKRIKLEAELSGLNASVRGRWASGEEYRLICNRQARIKAQLAECLIESQPIRAKLSELQALATYERVTVGAGLAPSVATNDVSWPVVRSRIIALRDRWLDFAEDRTRVSSMRSMAAQFAKELTGVVSLADAGRLSRADRLEEP
jgi:hypothetical protein